MKLEIILKTGDEVRLKGETDTYITTVDEVTGEDTFTIIAPYKRGNQVLLRHSEALSISCVTERGLYMLEARVTDINNTSGVAIIHLRKTSEVRRIQRRQAFRVKESVPVNARKKSNDLSPDGKWVKTSTIDIAEHGMLLRFNESCETGQEMELSIRLNMFGINEVLSKIKGSVIRCIPAKNKDFGFLLGIQFVDLPEKARDTLIKLVVMSQRNKLSYRNLN